MLIHFPFCTGFHSNAHSNNLVVLPETTAAIHSCFLAPLDLDMCFTRETFLHKTTDLSSIDTNIYDEWTAPEANNMAMQLAGMNYLGISTGVTATAAVPERLVAVQWMWRDTIMNGYG